MIKLNVDCLILIINELQTDKNDLYSCLLVNKEWSRLVIPILWKKYSWYRPPLDPYYEKKKLYNIILSWLPPSSKQILSNMNIKLTSTILSRPLFNYISFCEFPRAGIIDRITKMVFEESNNTGSHDKDKIKLLKQELYKLFISECKGIKVLWWDTSQPLSLLPSASACFSQLYSLYIDFNIVSPIYLHEMARICRGLNELTIYRYSQDLPGLISLIDAQRNLKRVVLCPNSNKGACEGLSKALAKKADTIDDLELYSVSAIQPFFLTSFINLKKLTIRNSKKCEDFKEEIREFLQYLVISEFSDLRSLTVDGIPCFKELAMLIEKTKGKISKIDIYNITTAKDTGILIESIANNCLRIESLSTLIAPNDFIHVKSLLINCRNLKNIGLNSLNFTGNENDDISGDELLNILTKFSPKSLTEILISKDWKYSNDVSEQFFLSCKERTCNLLFYHML